MSTEQDAVRWLKSTFGDAIRAAVAGTPFGIDLVAAIAMQETSYIWRKVYQSKPVSEVLSLCVGDTIGAPRRTAFPADREALEREPRGGEMFAIARKALEDVAQIDASYAKVAHNPDKFCHGYGMFQYDLQFFKQDPDFFLAREWATFDGTLRKCLGELRVKLKRTYGDHPAALTHDESVYVGIAYNAGHADLHKDFNQGFEDDGGIRYGVHLDKYLKMAESAV